MVFDGPNVEPLDDCALLFALAILRALRLVISIGRPICITVFGVALPGCVIVLIRTNVGRLTVISAVSLWFLAIVITAG